jgi:hypothetical protein
MAGRFRIDTLGAVREDVAVMASDPEGLRIAQERIARKRVEKSGFLDLGMLGLEDLPEEIWELEWLEVLVLGSSWQGVEVEFRQAGSKGAAILCRPATTGLRRGFSRN